MWPVVRHAASKAGDLLGIAMYSTSAGTIERSQVSARKLWSSFGSSATAAVFGVGFMAGREDTAALHSAPSERTRTQP